MMPAVPPGMQPVPLSPGATSPSIVAGPPAPTRQSVAASPATLPNATDNPCGRNAGFYHPYPGNQALFIQCDLTGNAFVQPCPSGLIWNQEVLTCIPPVSNTDSIFFAANVSRTGNETASVSGSGFFTGNGSLLSADVLPSSSAGGSGLRVDPCATANDGTFFPHPTNPSAFLHCANRMSTVRYCPPRLVWDQNILTCVVG
jgi:hypothetical protein